jgi:hypothetical protein
MSKDEVARVISDSKMAKFLDQAETQQVEQ